MADPTRWRAQVLALLRAEGPAADELTTLIRWVDRTLCEEASGVSFDWTSSGHVLLARMVSAAGKPLLEHDPDPGVEATLTAAREFALNPTKETAARYAQASTDSYPLGSMGHGCHSLERGGTCGPGSGCRSGSGTLAVIASMVGADVVWQGLKRELVPWLDGDRGPDGRDP